MSSICLENKRGLAMPQYNQMSLYVVGRLGIATVNMVKVAKKNACST